MSKPTGPFVETVRGVGANDVSIISGEVLTLSVASSYVPGGPQAVFDRDGVRLLIEALQTAEQHMTFNRPPAEYCPSCGCDLRYPHGLHIVDCGGSSE